MNISPDVIYASIWDASHWDASNWNASHWHAENRPRPFGMRLIGTTPCGVTQLDRIRNGRNIVKMKVGGISKKSSLKCNVK